jgi:hypothetical protein
MIHELIEHRVLGAVRFVHAVTGGKVADGLVVRSETAVLRRNRSGLWVIWNAPGLEAHTEVFDQPPDLPALGSVTFSLTVSDPLRRYLPRAAAIPLPRDPTVAQAHSAGSLFQPVDVPLYLTSVASISPGWAVIRAHVKNAGTGAPLVSALVRVLRVSNGQVVARGMSDDRGEALLVVPGIPVTTFNVGVGPVLATEIDVTVEAIFDPVAGTFTDPDAVESRVGLPSASSPRKLAAGRTLALELAVTVP